MKKIFDKLSELIGKENVFKDEPMSKHTTFKIGGNAELFITPRSVDQIMAAINLCKDNDIPYLIIGNGSNILVRDGGISGLVIKLGSGFSDIDICATSVRAQAGALLYTLCSKTLEASLKGLEGLIGIPGTVGGAVYMNAGAYGYEIKDCLKSIFVLDNGEIKEININDCDMGYRTSILKGTDMIVLEANFELIKDGAQAMKIAKEVMEKRKNKQPIEYPSAGSTFKRPKEGYASQLIDEANLKGYKIGGACVSDKHAGFIINIGGATAKHVLELMEYVKQKVFEHSGIMLEPEIMIVGHD